MTCLKCGGKAEGREQGETHKCLVCGFSWWPESSMYLRSDRMRMLYSIRTGSLLMEVPYGCLAVFGGEEVKV